MLIVFKLQLPICLSAHSCARSFVRLSIEPITIIPAESGFRPFTYRLAGADDLFSVNKQLTEHQHHGMAVGNQHSHKTKVCDKAEKKMKKFEVRVEGCPGSHRLCFS